MPVICFPNCGFLSETSRMVAIYRKFEELDLPVVMATHGGIHEFVLKDEKIPYEKIEPEMTPDDCRHYLKVCTTRPWVNLYDKSALKKTVTHESEFLKDVKAKAVITGFQLSLALSARMAGVPLVVTHFGSIAPPVIEKGMVDCKEALDNLITQFIPGRILNKLFTWLCLKSPLQLKLFNEVADELGIQKIRSFMDLAIGDLTLVTDVPEILQISEKEMEEWRPLNSKFYRPEARLKYAGALFARLFGEVPSDVRAFLNTDKPKIYVAMTSGAVEDLKRVFDTLRKMDIRAVFCSLVHSGKFKSTENILVSEFLPSHLVMPMCDLAIIYGGQGSVQTAIASGIPIIGFPLQGEQNFNLKQMERHGSGICMSLRSLRKGHLQDAINRVLRDRRYKKAMEQLQVWQSKRDGALEVAKAVRELISSREDCYIERDEPLQAHN